MHKTNTKINKVAIIIIYHHGINFVTLPKVKTRWWLYSWWKKLTHMLELNKNWKHYAYISKHKLNIKEKGKRKLKLLLILIFRWWLLLIILVVVPLLIRIYPAVQGQGAQAHMQYLHCPHLIEPHWIRWLRVFCMFLAAYPPIMAILCCGWWNCA
jgi:hypothetical protein